MIRPGMVIAAAALVGGLAGVSVPASAEVLVSGTVTDQNGLAVVGAEVVFRDQEAPDESAAILTDVTGAYRVVVTDPGSPTSLRPSSWAQLKRGGSGKATQSGAGLLNTEVFTVTITHADIATFVEDDVRIPASGVLDWVVQRLSDPSSDATTVTESGLAGSYADGFSLTAVIQVSVGDTVRLHLVGSGLNDVRQFDFILDLPDYLDAGGAKFSAATPFIGPGVDRIDDNQIRLGAGILDGDSPAGEFNFGELEIPAIAVGTGQQIVVRRISVGPTAGDRNTFEDPGLALPITVR